MFRIAKSLVKSIEQSVQDTLSFSQDSQLDAFFQSIPPNLILPQLLPPNYSPDDPSLTGTQPLFEFTQKHNNIISGLRIVYVDESQLQLQSYFDHIVGINDNPLPLVYNYNTPYPNYDKIFEILNNSVSSFVKFNIWSAKGGTFRDEYLSILPNSSEDELTDISLENISNNTTTHASNSQGFQKLSFKVQWSPLNASTFTYHILNLNIPNGPAFVAGLIPDEDYIIGCQDGLLATGGNGLLQDIIRSRANHSLILYVFNKIEDNVRPVTVNIGPDGRLGSNIGYGFLHRIPAPHGTVVAPTPANPNVTSTYSPNTITSPQQVPPQSSETFIPNAVVHPPLAKKNKPHAEKKEKKVNMMDYFNEGKDQSAVRKVDQDATPPPILHK
ncbi:hypothetical protein TBLA_0A07530 [Henningerozyma blattae CBS 6284]|uniref:PDZ GRASP-type domain-containing protein n=1 Tax=Henningerozyma blattae (strain ATCC 34711 / CBS 6284 / DSM 70876 / NBRC 10599 / NRRL Y-10934 / UCD 77-7) TaxID=1071380 RepID=I2GWP1_HENB6|nr:hypothetical protein TBLA_0A07530 [Tetrapisispora blattae CBS 6284]CCH58543.1 hypothetical protein TBLA_0A07530 [Tetrapisispora blattae CBS 6284]